MPSRTLFIFKIFLLFIVSKHNSYTNIRRTCLIIARCDGKMIAAALKNDFLALYSIGGAMYTHNGKDAESLPALEKAL